MNYPDQVKCVCKYLGLSQNQVTNALNVCFVTINRQENAKVCPSNLVQKTFYKFYEKSFIDEEKLKHL